LQDIQYADMSQSSGTTTPQSQSNPSFSQFS